MDNALNYLEEFQEQTYQQASRGKRLANYLIDVVFFYIAIFSLGLLLALIDPNLVAWMDYADNNPGYEFIDRIVTLLVYAVLMFIVEGLTGGRSIGKYITGTKCITNDGNTLDFKTAFVRNIIRAIPFEAFSALGNPSYPWHDKWSNTMVVDTKASS